MGVSTLGHDSAIFNLFPHNSKCNASKNLPHLHCCKVRSVLKKHKGEWVIKHTLQLHHWVSKWEVKIRSSFNKILILETDYRKSYHTTNLIYEYLYCRNYTNISNTMPSTLVQKRILSLSFNNRAENNSDYMGNILAAHFHLL